MLDQLEQTLLNALQTLFDQFGWWGVAGMMAFENATGITPSEITLTFAGWMLISAHDISPFFILWGGLYAALGSVFGASLTYWAARLGGRPMIDRMAAWFRMDTRHIETAEAHFQRWGLGLVLGGRIIPGIRTLVSIPAGLARMSYPVFLLATFAGTYLWCTLLIGAGYLLGHEWQLISALLKQWLPYLLALSALIFLFFFWWRSRRPTLSLETE